jgi:hypothetical protein
MEHQQDLVTRTNSSEQASTTASSNPSSNTMSATGEGVGVLDTQKKKQCADEPSLPCLNKAGHSPVSFYSNITINNVDKNEREIL